MKKEKSKDKGNKSKSKGEKAKQVQTKPKRRIRSFRQLRTEFRAQVKAGNEKRAWELAKLYNKRWNNR